MIPDSGARERLPELDALRGLAAVIVLVHHALLTLPPFDLPDFPGAAILAHSLTERSPLRAFADGRAPVLFFFVLSGFVLTHALRREGSPGLAAFAAQRTIRLMLPVAASVALSLALLAAVGDPDPPAELAERSLNTWAQPVTPGLVALNALLLTNDHNNGLNTVLWSLVHEWRLTLLLPLVLLFHGRVALLLGLALLAMAAGAFGGANNGEVHLGRAFHSSVAATVYFVPAVAAGAALALLGPLPVLTREQRLAAALALLGLFSLPSDEAIYAGSVLLILLAMQPGGFRDLLRWRLPVWLGALSFSLYLVHVPVLVAVLHALDGEMPAEAVMLLGVAAAILVATVMHRLVEVPSRRLARRVERRLATRRRVAAAA